jgi:hypothetical protein
VFVQGLDQGLNTTRIKTFWQREYVEMSCGILPTEIVDIVDRVGHQSRRFEGVTLMDTAAIFDVKEAEAR